MYKFRTVDALLDGYHELENQELFFSDLTQLNDPMEGFIDFTWSGDAIVWKNFFSHYLLCLENITVLAGLVEDDYVFTKNDIPIYKTIEDFPTQLYKEIFTRMVNSFQKNKVIIKYIDFLSKRSTAIDRTELKCHLKSVHFIALSHIIGEYRKAGMYMFGDFKLPNMAPILNLLKVWELNKKDIEHDTLMTNLLYRAQINIHEQMGIINRYNQPEEKRGKIKTFILLDYPDEFVEKVIELAYPNAYISCFTSNCNSPAMWGYYGDKHKGICLKFKTDIIADKPCIKLNTIIGHGNSGKIKGISTHKFEKVRYSKKYPQINFFRSMGRLTLHALDKYWYSSANGEVSNLSNHLNSEASRRKWHRNYWRNHLNCLTIKLPDWRKEEEYRIVIDDLLGSYKEIQDRKFKYDFNDLEGIVFGYRTSIDDKLKIMKIIENKCRENSRKDFDFYQAEYIPETGKIGLSKLNLLKFQ